MAQNKSELFEEASIAIAEVAKALSHPARLEILKVLAKRNMCICGEIVEVLPLSQSTVSQHLKALKSAGLISGVVEGPRSCYCIDWEKLNEAFRWIAQYAKELSDCQSNNCC